MVDLERLEREALRVYGRFEIEIVEGLGFCPWAEEARLGGHVRPSVLLSEDPSPDEVTDRVLSLSADAEVAIGLIIFPRLGLDRSPFSRFVGRVREAYEARTGRGRGEVAMADFHPNAQADTSAAERLVPFVRRSPDPTIQVVRMSALEKVRMSDTQGTSFVDPAEIDLEALARSGPPAAAPPLHQRIARNNLKTLQRRGLAEVNATIEAIHADRHSSYAALGLPPPAWAAAPGPDTS